MSSALSLSASSLSGRSFESFLRPRQIDRLSLITKTALYGIALITPVFVIRDVLTHYFVFEYDKSQIEEQVSGLLRPPPPSTEQAPTKEYNAITEKALFGDFTQTSAPQATPKPISKLALTLVGTYVRKKDSSAIIEDTKKSTQDVFQIGERIFGEAKLVAIYSDRVEVERDGKTEILSLDEGSTSGDSGSSDGTEITVAEADIDDALNNLPRLLTQARAVPFFKEGQAVGLRMFAIQNGSLFDKIGLKNGDILKTINGNDLGDFSQAMKLFERLKSERTISMSLERNREEKQFTYKIR